MTTIYLTRVLVCFPTSRIWLGATDLAAEGDFVWESDGSDVNAGHTNWQDGEPNGGSSHNCLGKNGAHEDLKWGDADCENIDNEYYILCESV